MKFICIVIFLSLFVSGCQSTQNFDYSSLDRIYFFDENDKVDFCSVEEAKNLARDNSQVRIISTLNNLGQFEVFDTKTKQVIRTSGVGERIMPIAYDKDSYYFYSNANSEYYRLEKYSLSSQEFEVILEKNCDLEHIFYYMQDASLSLAVATFSDSGRFYFEKKFKHAEDEIKAKYDLNSIFWLEKSKQSDKWLVRLLYRDRPESYLVYDFENKQIYELKDSFKNWQKATKREEISYYSRDGLKISAIITSPLNAKARLPLVVFPHGGPVAKSDTNFDFRCEILARAGFIVFQPNYRASARLGKSFSFAGFGVDGIKKAQFDIEDGVKFLIEKEIVDSDKIAIFGGSWGAFCAAYALTFSPQYYKAGVLFFGAYDLVEMLKKSPTPINYGLDKLQYGELPKDEKALSDISPINFVENIQSPILIYHFKGDDVSFCEQSEKYVQALKQANKDVKFITGEGKHGFKTDAEEEQEYKNLIKFFKGKLKSKEDF